MKKEPKKQHEVPKTYLKRFVIDQNNRKDRSFVECFRIFPKKLIERKSIDSNFFKTENFYTVESNNPYVIEESFSNLFEPFYNEIMVQIENEIPLTKEIKQKLLLWIWFSKYRNSHQRSSLKQITNFLLTAHTKNTTKSIDEFNDLVKGIKEYSDSASKIMQLQSLFTEEHINLFADGMEEKHWMILKSNENNMFITNDNPGFSVNMNLGLVDKNTINVQFATNNKAANYYPLSPKYCLLISPFIPGTLETTNFWNLKIKYVKTNDVHIDFINNTTFTLIRKYCLSNNIRFLNKYLSIDLSQQNRFSGLPMIPIGEYIIREGE